MSIKSSFVLGFFVSVGLLLLGLTLGGSLIKYKELERTVVVKGLAQKEVKADIVIWPITFLRASNNLSELYSDLESDAKKISRFLLKQGFAQKEISISAPSVTDKVAQNYGGTTQPKYRYSATQTITLYTEKIDLSRESMNKITALGKEGITFRTNSYENRVEYIYTKLNEIKPEMLQEATKNARASAQTFADDSQSSLGKIKKAKQGQFSITARDTNTPYIKRVRVVSTVEYYLAD